jgi:glycosyltransferase involved in cell wall biosynthesis
MNILHVDTGETFRGGQQQALFLMRGLRSLQHTQWLIVPPGSPLAAKARQEDFEIEEIATRQGGALFASSRIRNVLRRLKPDLLHFHDSRSHGFGLMANRQVRLPAVISRRVAFPIKMGLFSRAKYFFPRQRFIAVSHFIKQIMVDTGIDSSLIDVVHDAVDVSIAPVQTRRKYAVSSEEVVIGSVGALEAEKGFDLLIEALAIARNSLPHPRCIIAGSGSEQPRLEGLVSQHQLGSLVQIIPMPETLHEFIEALDLFVLPSRTEGFGSILLLAMHCATPVLASDAGGIPELIEDEKTGFLFPKENVGAMAGRLIDLAQNGQRRNSVVQLAAERVRNHFSIAAMTEGTLKTYRTALETA